MRARRPSPGASTLCAKRWSCLIAIAGVVCVLGGSASAHSPRHRVAISRAGSIGSLKLNVSTLARVEHIWGPPAFTMTGNMDSPSPGYPNYTQLGYECHADRGATTCATNFYISQRSQRLESFATTSQQFVLFGGVHVGMAADAASHREHRPNFEGCGQGIGVSTPTLSVGIDTKGGRTQPTAHGLRVTGGSVVEITIDEKRYGVGLLFC